MSLRCSMRSFSSFATTPLCLRQWVRLVLHFEIQYTNSRVELLLSPASVVLKLAQQNRFDQAIATARSLNVDMTDIFSHLTMQCLRLSRRQDTLL